MMCYKLTKKGWRFLGGLYCKIELCPHCGRNWGNMLKTAYKEGDFAKL